MSQKINIALVIGPDGSLTFEVHGMKGAGCQELSREVAALLDAEVVEVRNTSEFYQGQANLKEHHHGFQ